MGEASLDTTIRDNLRKAILHLSIPVAERGSGWNKEFHSYTKVIFGLYQLVSFVLSHNRKGFRCDDQFPGYLIVDITTEQGGFPIFIPFYMLDGLPEDPLRWLPFPGQLGGWFKV